MSQLPASNQHEFRAGAIIRYNDLILCVYQNVSQFWGFPKGVPNYKIKPQIAYKSMIPATNAFQSSPEQAIPSITSFVNVIKGHKPHKNELVIGQILKPTLDNFPTLNKLPATINKITLEPTESWNKIVNRTYINIPSYSSSIMNYERESIKDTVIREVREEVGIKLTLKQLQNSKQLVVNGHYYYVIDYYHKPKVEIQDKSEIRFATWFTLEELFRLKLSSHTRAAIKLLSENLIDVFETPNVNHSGNDCMPDNFRS